ncbi:tyrosine-protein kinase family protein [Ovoidimarina sediminis]|uniref:tyrosine-protein kinase family protein n=1 Tax=Ovoidimarina sediminis TaxID=3079856 RepID=UPI0029150D6C|nr:CpsD/CapB family tyrosine-protein kinase [Rhodophyticola sp. MJ-SS7]MDU8942573.1 CpsD/CapB family tyrosine-protein kinase [Rhodophyticola sp. MJ-SS7]
MEKLQAAIEKARQRREATAAATGKSPAEARSASRAEEPGGDVWQAIPEHTVAAKTARRNRLFLDGRTAEASYFDKLRTKLIQQCRDNQWRRVLVTSATKGCGKTTTCANLAASFARQKDRRVMVFDMDMRRPDLRRPFGISNSHGFSDVLEGSVPFEETAVRLGASVIISANQSVHPNPSQIILQDQTARVIDEIEARYRPDVMLFDTPPMLSADDTLGLVKHMDCAIIVAGAEMSTIAQVDEVERELAEVTNVMGVVLNRCNYIDQAQTYYY